MATPGASKTDTRSGSIPYTGNLSAGLILIVSTEAEGSASLFATALYDGLQWHFSEAQSPGTTSSTGIYLTSVSVAGGNISWSGETYRNWGWTVVIQTDKFPTTLMKEK